KMQPFNLLKRSGLNVRRRLADPHPSVTETHEHKNHGDEILITKTRVIFRQTEGLCAVACWIENLILHSRSMPETVGCAQLGRDFQFWICNPRIAEFLKLANRRPKADLELIVEAALRFLDCAESVVVI